MKKFEIVDSDRSVCVFNFGKKGFFSEFNNYLFGKYLLSLFDIGCIVNGSSSNLPAPGLLSDYFSFDLRPDLPFVDPLILGRCRELGYSPEYFSNILDCAQSCANDLSESENLNGLLDGCFASISTFFINHWQLSKLVRDEVESIKRRLYLDGPYIALHIRRGDKLRWEADPVSLSSYISKISFGGCNTIFVATDDYSCVEYLAKKFPSLRFCTSAPFGARGHNQVYFNGLDTLSRRNELVRLIAEVDLLVGSIEFVGSYSSNIGRLVHLLRSGRASHSVDIPFTYFYDPTVSISGLGYLSRSMLYLKRVVSNYIITRFKQ